MTAAFLTGADAPTEVPLKRRLKQAERAHQVKALALVLPLLAVSALHFPRSHRRHALALGR